VTFHYVLFYSYNVLLWLNCLHLDVCSCTKKLKTNTIIRDSIFWAISPYSPLKVNRHFGETCLQSLLATCFTLASGLAYSSTLKMEATYSSETSIDFQDVHGVISQKIDLFLTTAVRTSNPIYHIYSCNVLLRIMSIPALLFRERKNKDSPPPA
jgi:hypothetical protein